jgi:nucleotide-binding universal stress UspA family protein
VKRILIATDGAHGSDAAVDEGLDLASTLGAEVLFVTVRQPGSASFGFPSYAYAETPEEDGSRAAADAALEEAHRAGVEAEAAILEGVPAHAIVELARERDVDLIVLGSRGRGAFAGALLGSVSRAVARDADRPVLIAKHRRPAELLQPVA